MPDPATSDPATLDPARALPAAARVLALAEERGLTLATAESLTGGGVGAVVTSVPGASRVYVGGVVAYAGRVKVELLGVPPEVVEEHGVVSEPCARAMAEGVCRLLGADIGVATTGVAGPDPQEGKAAGTVHVAVAVPGGTHARLLRLDGDRSAVRTGTARGVLELAAEVLAGAPVEPDADSMVDNR
ncbi:CinA family protein [Nocardioides caldifontis]|uniref:CinA family protein n=1 Tax=Nocardioides caldifontis TaxID=2588938 RepID=UPI001EF0648F|nr:CinA family protein [Nocardioides caldifontis]